MIKDKARKIYTWWRKLPLWLRVPLVLVLLVALVLLVINWYAELVSRALWPSEPNPYGPMMQARVEQSKRNAEKLRTAVEKADQRYTEIREEMKTNDDTLHDFEEAMARADSIDDVDDLIAEHVERHRQRAGKSGD